MPPLPDLPAGFRWGPPGRDAGIIPVQVPPSEARAHRWAAALTLYGTVHPAPATVVDPSGVVAALAPVQYIGRHAALALGRTYRPVATLEKAARAAPDGGSLLVVAPARACTLGGVITVTRVCARRSIRLGWLTGVDTPAVSFALAKILADRWSLPWRGQVLVDGISGTAHSQGTPVPLHEAVDGRWQHLLIDAHGNSAHALAGDLSLCGLLGEREHHLDGVPVPGGCADSRCRAAGPLQPLPVRELRARVLGLFVCSAMTLDLREHYPTNVSLGLAAVESAAAHTLGLSRQDANTTQNEPELTGRLWAGGHAQGTVAGWLNQDTDHCGIDGSYLLLGDPEAAHPQPGNTSLTHTPWPCGRRPHLVHLTGPGVRSERADALLTHKGVLNTGPATATDAAEATQVMQEQLHAWLVDLEQAVYVEENLRALRLDKPRVHQALRCMRRHREAAHAHTVDLLRRLRTFQRRRRGTLPQLHHGELGEHAQAWAHAVADLHLHSRTGMLDRLRQCLEGLHQPGTARERDPCSFCGCPLTHTHLTRAPGAGADRTVVTCPRCGLVSTSEARTRLSLALDSDEARPGTAITLRATTPHASPAVAGLVTVQLRPRERLGALDHAQQATPSGATAAFALAVPADLDPQLLRIWALYTHRFRTGLHQFRVPSALPTPSGGTP